MKAPRYNLCVFGVATDSRAIKLLEIGFSRSKASGATVLERIYGNVLRDGKGKLNIVEAAVGLQYLLEFVVFKLIS